ncbi:alanine--tRNA ligase [Natroniella sulfidigena]|uniref:alanine--tRNA ligase n=1 Tax=Natroniella sulfidigena TaxID=723921 RepID=UPI002009E602|nr:alanine--tRNA ligase [Natroniella sulfidigena]
MIEMSSTQIRQKFLDFFADKGHQVLPSAPLVPQDDPTLLWINAGMAPFKDYFNGSATPPNSRIATSQKCIRTNDITNVGKTARHHTFFEMLGNFSFGDYFKEEAIEWAYQFLTEELGLEVDKLWISIYKDDDRAFEIWHQDIGIPKDRIVRMDKDENFWEIGTGPCGPCSEIHYDRGIEFGCPDGCKLGCDCDRYLEVWNLVFTQYNKTEDGEYLDLPNKNIDTGVGLERLASLLQGAPTNFETDLFMPMIEFITQNCDVEYGESKEADLAIKVIADHIRSITFAIGDGALPSNEGRGYVVRRVLRRAVRYAKVLGLEAPFLHKIVAVVVEVMGDHYSELVKREEQIVKIIKQEELRFEETLEQGMNMLDEVIAELKEDNLDQIPGDKVFMLYDTYGFPVELTEEIASEQDFKVDLDGFEKAMQQQRNRAREAREDYDQGHGELELFKDLRKSLGASQFVGYEEQAVRTEVLGIVKDEQQVTKITAGEEAKVILEKTPFYAESGGQVADKGIIETDSASLKVIDVQEIADVIVHQVELEAGSLEVGAEVKAQITSELRVATARNHTATHLLQQALKEVLGDHVKQSGSLVTPNRLRFDFTHFEAVTKEQLRKVEEVVNQKIIANLAMKIEKMELEQAKEVGATALFGEKYGEQVRVVKIGDYSLELCGGTHVDQTGEIGFFKILDESGIAAGVRRIEAVTGQEGLNYVQQQEDMIADVATKLKANPDEIVDKVVSLQNELKSLEKEITSLKDKLASSQSEDLISKVEEINGVNVLIDGVDGLDNAGLRKMGDNLKQELDSGIIILGSKVEEKVAFVAMITDDLVEQGYHAGEIIGQVAQVAGGGGGGRPTMAQAGGSRPDKLTAALEKAKEIIVAN